jgi:hypothetical protein
VKVPPGTRTNTVWTKPLGLFLKDIFFSKLFTIRQQSPPESAYANSPKECESIETVLSLRLSARVHWFFGFEVMAFTITNTAVLRFTITVVSPPLSALIIHPRFNAPLSPMVLIFSFASQSRLFFG